MIRAFPVSSLETRVDFLNATNYEERIFDRQKLDRLINHLLVLVWFNGKVMEMMGHWALGKMGQALTSGLVNLIKVPLLQWFST